MDTIKGLKLSYLLVNNLLTKDDLTNIYKNLNIIHSSKVKIKNNKLNIYKNYYEKVKIRIGNDKTTINKFGIKNFIN